MSPWLTGLLAWHLVLAAVTFLAYGHDKRRAIQGGQRVPEARLHLLELLGGWPGALAAQRLLRHKSRKLSYRVVLWGIVTLHAVAWLTWGAWRLGLVAS